MISLFKSGRISNQATIGFVSVLSAFALLALATAAAADPFRSVVGSAHDLSASGGAVKGEAGQAQDQVCVYCHVPHNAVRRSSGASRAVQQAAAFAASDDAPLWNRKNGADRFSMYSVKNSASFALTSGDTNDADRLVGPVSLGCLSCHDGQTAFNSLNQTPSIDSARGVSASAYTFRLASGRAVGNLAQASAAGPGSANLGTDLRDDHPVSFTYDSALAALKGKTLRDPAASAATSGGGDLVIHRLGEASAGGPNTIAAQMLFARAAGGAPDQLECTSCHEPHMQGNPADPGSNYPFLIKSNQRSRLCLTCHDK